MVLHSNTLILNEHFNSFTLGTIMLLCLTFSVLNIIFTFTRCRYLVVMLFRKKDKIQSSAKVVIIYVFQTHIFLSLSFLDQIIIHIYVNFSEIPICTLHSQLNGAQLNGWRVDPAQTTSSDSLAFRDGDQMDNVVCYCLR